MPSAKPTVPASGKKITISGGQLQVPDHPIVPFIEGDGTGPDIWRASVRVLDAAVAKAYGGKRKIEWMEVYAGQKAFDSLKTWLPDETIDAFREFQRAGNHQIGFDGSRPRIYPLHAHQQGTL